MMISRSMTTASFASSAAVGMRLGGDHAAPLRASAPHVSFPDEDRGCAARGTLIALLVVAPFWVVFALLY